MPTPCAGGFSRHSQPLGKALSFGHSCYQSEILLSPRELHTSGRGTECFATGPGAGTPWHSLRAPSLGSRSRRVTKTTLKREGSFSRRQRWCGTYLGCFGAPSKALIRLYPEGNLCQLSGHSVRTAVTSPGCRDLPSTPIPSLQSTPGPPSQLPVLHHPAPDGFPQAVTTHLVSPRTCRSPVTFSGAFVLIKATPEATGYLPCLSADLHTLTTAQPTRGAGCGPRHVRITTDQRRRSQSFSPVIVGSADKHQK